MNKSLSGNYDIGNHLSSTNVWPFLFCQGFNYWSWSVYLFQVDDKYSSEGRWHEAIDEKIDAGIDCDEEMRNGHPDQGPKGYSKTPIFNGGSDNLECK